jgi:hypothetical protein
LLQLALLAHLFLGQFAFFGQTLLFGLALLVDQLLALAFLLVFLGFALLFALGSRFSAGLGLHALFVELLARG